MSEPPIHKWADRLEAAIAEHQLTVIDRVVFVAETASTQDAAARFAGSTPGLLLLTGNQTRGRGRLGRDWNDTAGRSLAMTIVLDANAHPPAFIALAAGVAVAKACALALPEDTIGIKWPNDVIERKTSRKVAGILVETAGPLTFVGIGVNVGHTAEELKSDRLPAAASLVMLGGDADRVQIAEAIAIEFEAAIMQPEADLITRWRKRDAITGTQQSFRHNTKTYTGIVESIDPTLTLVVRTREGLKRLPALETSVVPPDRG